MVCGLIVDGVCTNMCTGILLRDMRSSSGEELRIAEAAREAERVPLVIDRGWVSSGIVDYERVFVEALDGVEEGEVLVFAGDYFGDRNWMFYVSLGMIYRVADECANFVSELDLYSEAVELWRQGAALSSGIGGIETGCLRGFDFEWN